MIIKSSEVNSEEHRALRTLTVVPYIPAPLSEQFADKVSNATILRTIRHNVEEWKEAAENQDLNAVGRYWAGRVSAYEKVLDLIDNLKEGLK